MYLDSQLLISAYFNNWVFHINFNQFLLVTSWLILLGYKNYNYDDWNTVKSTWKPNYYTLLFQRNSCMCQGDFSWSPQVIISSWFKVIRYVTWRLITTKDLISNISSGSLINYTGGLKFSPESYWKEKKKSILCIRRLLFHCKWPFCQSSLGHAGSFIMLFLLIHMHNHTQRMRYYGNR